MLDRPTLIKLSDENQAETVVTSGETTKSLKNPKPQHLQTGRE